MQSLQTNSILLFPGAGHGTATELAGLPDGERVRDILWDKDGNLLAVTRHAILRLALDGNHQSTIFSDPNAVIASASACPNGGPILLDFGSRGNSGRLNVWRVDADGSHPKQLTQGVDDESPVCAADGKSFYYADLDKKSVINRMPIDGGTPELIKASAMKNGFVAALSANTSPDGRWLPAIVTQVDPATQADIHALGLIDVAANTESSLRTFPSQPTITLPVLFTPDWKNVAYRVIANGTDNIWMQPVDGSPGHAVTNFTTDHIRGFSWSPDGKALAVVRTHTVSDVVLLREGKAAQ
jgi:Tol biopolymer transport system component